MKGPIETLHKTIQVVGQVFYNDRRRRIDIKKPIRDLFACSTLPVKYIMELGFSEQAIVQRVKELMNHRVMPVILYFSVGGDEPCDVPSADLNESLK